MISVNQQLEPRTAISWPNKFDVLGVGVSSIDYDQAIDVIIQAAVNKQSALVDHMPVHGLIEASSDPALKQKIKWLNGFGGKLG
jgi:hypothetical protein